MPNEQFSRPKVSRRRFVNGLTSLAAASTFSLAVTGETAAQVTEGDDTHTQTLSSPDGSVKVTVDVADGVPNYSVDHKDTTVIADSTLGFEFEDQPAFGEGVTVTGSERSRVDETWTPVWDQYDEIREHYEELRIGLQESGGPGRALTFAVRVFDDGVGFRYVFPEDSGFGEFAISSERTEFAFADDYTSWWIQSDFNSYEYAYNETPLSEIGSQSPTGGAHTPMTMKAAEDRYVSVHEANLVDYAAMAVEPTKETTFESNLAPLPNGTKVTASAPHRTPWRTIQVGEHPGDLVESNLVVNLNDPRDPDDFPQGTDWIEPQKFIGIWWLMITGRADWEYMGPQTGNHGAQTGRMKQYMDFASEHSIPSVLVEGWNEGWSTYPEGGGTAMDFDDPYPDFDWDEITDYGLQLDPPVEMTSHNETAGGITNYESQLAEDPNPFADYEDKGIRSIKTGYVADSGVTIDGSTHNHHCQPMVNHHHLVYRKAAQHRQMLEVHEPIHPTGERRTYPNVMTREGVLGQEYDAFGDVDPSHHVTFPFTRMLGGPVEYTPGIFDMDSGSGGIETTRAKQLAMYPNYFSGLQMAADLPSSYLADQPARLGLGEVAQAEFGDIEGFPTAARWANAQGERYVQIDPNTASNGSTVSWVVEGVESADEYDLHLRYASDDDLNAVPAETPRTATVSVNGSSSERLTFPATAYWDEWGTVSTTVSLDAGENTVTVVLTNEDTGGLNLDSIAVTDQGESMPEPDTVPIRGPTVDEFEFIEDVPAGGWDDTRVLDAEIGKYMITAREKDEKWYVGAMTDESGRTLDIPLAFLAPGKPNAHEKGNGHDKQRGKGHKNGNGNGHTKHEGNDKNSGNIPKGPKYVAEIYADGPEASFPADSDRVKVYERVVDPSDTLLASLVDTGGQAIRLRRANGGNRQDVPRYERPTQSYSGGTIAEKTVVDQPFITVSGTNDGNVVGGDELTVFVDGTERSTELVRLAPGSDSDTLSFSLESTGTYDVEVKNDGEVITSGTVNVRLTTGERIAHWSDDTGDDYGPGSYTYPTDSAFKDGVLDLTSIDLYDLGDRYRLIYRVDSPITNPYLGAEGYSLQLLQLYVRDPEASDNVPSTTEGRTGTGVTFEEPYHYRIVAAGGLQTIEDANGDTIPSSISTTVLSAADAIQVTFPKSAVGGSLDGTELAILLFGADSFQPGRTRRVNTTNSQYFFGGGRDDEMDPKVIDMITPDDITQSEALAYDANQRANVPYINL